MKESSIPSLKKRDNMKDPKVSRRTFLKKVALSGGMALVGTFWPGMPLALKKISLQAQGSGFLVEGRLVHDNGPIRKLVARMLESVGGMSQFVSRGDIVVIKPNISWARSPEYAATTNPEVLRAVVELCLEAGAKKVRIADNTIHDPRRCFSMTGASAVAKMTGAELVYPRSSLMRRMKVGGKRVDVWPVLVPLVEADKIINIPVAKHHSLSSLTLGMKNWIGGVGGSRWALHQDIHQSIVDLARFFKPTITLIDAIRILTRNGPSGGSLSYVSMKNTLILSNDPVASDARAAMLFGMKPEDLGFVRLGQTQGLGTAHLDKLKKALVSL